MDSRLKIAWHEYQNVEQYLSYYEETATLSQALLYIAYGLRPMSDKWHRIKRKTPLYNVNKSKEGKISRAKDLLFTALIEDRLQAYGQKGIGKAIEYRDDRLYSPFTLYLSPEHETNFSLIPLEFWDPIQTNFDENYVFIADHLSYINVKIQTEKLMVVLPFEYTEPELQLTASKKYNNEDIEFVLFAIRYFFETSQNHHFTKSSKGLAAKLQTKYKELTGRIMSDNKAKVLTSIFKNEYKSEKIIRKIKSL
jgi:hypothetical protein